MNKPTQELLDYLVGVNQITAEDAIIFEAIQDARKVQEFIWGALSLSKNNSFDADIWGAVFEKRVDKIKDIDKVHPHYKAELRKRILQQAALSICALKLIDKLTP